MKRIFWQKGENNYRLTGLSGALFYQEITEVNLAKRLGTARTTL